MKIFWDILERFFRATIRKILGETFGEIPGVKFPKHFFEGITWEASKKTTHGKTSRRIFREIFRKNFQRNLLRNFGKNFRRSSERDHQVISIKVPKWTYSRIPTWTSGRVPKLNFGKKPLEFLEKNPSGTPLWTLSGMKQLQMEFLEHFWRTSGKLTELHLEELLDKLLKKSW